MAFYPLEEHEYRYRPLGGSFTAWTGCTVKPIPVGDINIAAGDFQVRVMANGSRPAGNVLSNDSAFTMVSAPVENVTPAAPTVTADDTANTLSFSHALGTGEILVSINNAAYGAYAGPYSIGDVARAAGYYKAKIKAATGRNESAVTSSPAFTVAPVQNTTPAAPTVTGDDQLNILSASHALGSSEIVYSENGGAFVPYVGALSIGDVARSAGYWKFKIKAATGRNESAVTNSPAFTVAPPVLEGQAVFVEGHSMNTDYAQTDEMSWPEVFTVSHPDVPVHNTAVPGSSGVSRSSLFNTAVLPYFDNTKDLNILFIWAYVNDLDTATPNHTAIRSSLTSWVSNAVNAGFKVILFTELHMNPPAYTTEVKAQRNADIDTHNTWVRANWAALGASVLVDIATDYRLTQPAYFVPDGVHNNIAGRTVVSGLASQGFDLVVNGQTGVITGEPAPVVSNVAPVANAGPDQSFNLPTNSATLAGSATDSDGTIASYLWAQVSGPNTATISNAAIANPTVSGLVEGTYVFRLTVTDDDGATHQDTVQVTVNPPVSTDEALPGGYTGAVAPANGSRLTIEESTPYFIPAVNGQWTISGSVDPLYRNTKGCYSSVIGATATVQVYTRYAELFAPKISGCGIIEMSLRRLSDNYTQTLTFNNGGTANVNSGAPDGNTPQLVIDGGKVAPYEIKVRVVGGQGNNLAVFDAFGIRRA